MRVGVAGRRIRPNYMRPAAEFATMASGSPKVTLCEPRPVVPILGFDYLRIVMLLTSWPSYWLQTFTK